MYNRRSIRLQSSDYLDFKWQRNYYEHIIRNDKELYEIRKYIMENPLRWELDRNHPKNMNNKFQEKTYV